jgi:hypothetical protein
MLVFNRGRVMVLPQGINKATGLREALNTLRLSLHNCIGIGDAENDFALLEACEIGVAVGWGSKSLCAIADDVLPGSGPAAVADYIRQVSTHTKLPPNRTDRRRVEPFLQRGAHAIIIARQQRRSLMQRLREIAAELSRDCGHGAEGDAGASEPMIERLSLETARCRLIV